MNKIDPRGEGFLLRKRDVLTEILMESVCCKKRSFSTSDFMQVSSVINKVVERTSHYSEPRTKETVEQRPGVDSTENEDELLE